MKEKKVPMRMCVGCHESKPKRELIRVVRDPSGTLILDAAGKRSGRGAYLCQSTACLQKARKGRKLERALEAEVSGEMYEVLAARMEEAYGRP